MTKTIDIIEGLWANGRDSILHALDHFSERDRDHSDRRQHHDKWIVLSVYHAADCICNMRLLELEPSNSLLQRVPCWFPSLTSTINQLKTPQNDARLSMAERQLFVLLEKVSDIRHKFMHRIAPEDVDVSVAAMCMIGLLKYVERLKGEAASNIVWQSRPIEADVVSAIRWQRLDEYSKFVALFLCEKYPDHRLPECPACGVEAVVSTQCEACFEELDYVRCTDCEEEVYFGAWERWRGALEVKCQNCGSKHVVS